ncbi:hypothetical protein DL765_010262 [Monosporascus sp. GIB2]|nr:hypothetical protein DL765_010262 [Monosporascus sp. GIB2]
MPARAVPYCRCLDGMCRWSSGSAPVCTDDESASNKCGYCKAQARAIALIAAMAAHPGLQQPVKAAQVAVKKALQGKKVAAAMLAAKKAEFDAAAATERQESKRLAAERLASAGEKNAKAVDEAVETLAELIAEQRRAADALEGIHMVLASLQKLYYKVNAAAFKAFSRRGSTSLLKNREDEKVIKK